MEIPQGSEFWIGLVQIIWINIILSGVNVVVIAAATGSLLVVTVGRALAARSRVTA